MRKTRLSISHAFFLLRHLGFRRFAIASMQWMVLRYGRLMAPCFRLFSSTAIRRSISKNPVLVYVMPKAGSTSLTYSLRYAYLKAGITNVRFYHAHTLTNLDQHEQLVRAGTNSHEHLSLIHDYQEIRNLFNADPNEKWTVISSIRDPVARQLSDYFHHIDQHWPNWQSRWNEQSLTINQIQQHFLSLNDPTYDWFETDLKAELGLDVYQKPFPHQTGFQIYADSSKLDLLVFRLEDLNRVAPQAIEQLIGLKNFKLHAFNLASESRHSEIYKRFKAQALPKDYLERAYATRMARYFYSDKELDEFTEKWSKGTPTR